MRTDDGGDDGYGAGGRRRRHKPSTDSAALSTPTAAIPVVSVPEGVELTPLAIESGPTREATGTPARAGTDTDVEVVSSSSRPAPLQKRPDPAAAVRLGAAAAPDFAALASRPLGESAADLPLGEFQYPVKRGRGGKAIWIFAMLAMGVLGFVGVVYLVPMLQKKDVAASANPPAAAGSAAPLVAAAAPPAPVPSEQPGSAAATPDAAAAPEPDVTTPPTPVEETHVDTSNGQTAGKAGGQTGGKTGGQTGGKTGGQTGGKTSGQTGGKTGNGKTTTTAGGTDAKAGSGSAEEPEQEPPVAPPITDSDCDEVACVLAKYNKPCCERYRPKEADMKPRGAGGVPTELDKVAVRAGIQSVKPTVVACGEKHPAKGTVKIAVKVKPDGSVTDASVASSPDDELGSCVAAALRKAQFAKTVNGGSFTYPFVF